MVGRGEERYSSLGVGRCDWGTEFRKASRPGGFLFRASPLQLDSTADKNEAFFLSIPVIRWTVFKKS